MSIKQIITNVDELQTPCDNKNTIYKPNNERVIVDLLQTIHSHQSCIGLAANQIGYNARIFVMRYDANDLVIIDPKIIKRKQQFTYRNESCMSCPGVVVRVRRYDKILVRYKKLNGGLINRWFKDVPARMFQHELDHLNGVLILS